jgi:hypothetical protein
MTKAYRFEKLTGLAGLQQSSFDPETVGKGEVLVKVRAVALNRRELLIAESARRKAPKDCDQPRLIVLTCPPIQSDVLLAPETLTYVLRSILILCCRLYQ